MDCIGFRYILVDGLVYNWFCKLVRVLVHVYV